MEGKLPPLPQPNADGTCSDIQVAGELIAQLGSGRGAGIANVMTPSWRLMCNTLPKVWHHSQPPHQVQPGNQFLRNSGREAVDLLLLWHPKRQEAEEQRRRILRYLHRPAG